MAQLNFDASTVQPDEGRDYTPLPAGDYPVIIESSDSKLNSKGTGHNLSLVNQVIDGPFKGRKIFDRITLSNRNSAEAERIGQGQLSALCHAVGVLRVNDSVQLHGKPYLITVKIVPARDGYDAKNEVTKRAPLNRGGAAPAFAATPTAVTAAPSTVAPPAVATAPPWAGNVPAAAVPAASSSPWQR